MDVKLNLTDTTKDKDQRSDNKLKLQDSPVIHDESTTGQTESFTQVTSFSEETTEDTQVSSADIFEDGAAREAAFISSPCCVEEEQPKRLGGKQTSSVEACRGCDGSHTFTSIRSQESVKTMTIQSEPDGDDLCAAFLLACLFCHPLDCLLATMKGCNQCVWLLCSFMCGCEPTSLQPLLDVTRHCELCGCLGVRSCLCECPVCDICLQATECLDLAMEISQMLYH